MTDAMGLLHPGAMGSSVGAAARSAGSDVVWASEGRSAATTARAQADGLRDVGHLDALLAESAVVVSVCPPDAAEALAARVARRGYRGVFVDANAIDPATARRIGAAVERAGARFVDGGIIGPPARQGGTTWLHLSGVAAGEVADRFRGSLLDARVMDGGPGGASALKMAFASYTKGQAALLLAVRALARAEGVEAALLAQWERTHPQLAALSEATARGTAPKAWRFVGEMGEIANTYEARGLPDGFHRAAAEIYRRLSGFKDSEESDLDAVLAALLA